LPKPSRPTRCSASSRTPALDEIRKATAARKAIPSRSESGQPAAEARFKAVSPAITCCRIRRRGRATESRGDRTKAARRPPRYSYGRTTKGGGLEYHPEGEGYRRSRRSVRAVRPRSRPGGCRGGAVVPGRPGGRRGVFRCPAARSPLFADDRLATAAPGGKQRLVCSPDGMLDADDPATA